jgi:hypothetical protein
VATVLSDGRGRLRGARSGLPNRRAQRPAAWLPRARPSMNAASTLVIAALVEPKTRVSRRAQMTW